MLSEPSETMRKLYEVAEPNWQRLRTSNLVTAIVGALAEVPGADGPQMGWTLIHQFRVLANVADELPRHIKARAFTEQSVQGFRSGALHISVIGCELISREDLRDNGGFQVPEPVTENRPSIVANAETALTQALYPPEYVASLVASIRDQGEHEGKGLYSILLKQLPGIDPAQAGLALLTTGGFMFSQGARVGADEATRGLFRTRKKAGEGMIYAGMALAGAFTALCGDRCLS
jgi:hypothetical protein